MAFRMSTPDDMSEGSTDARDYAQDHFGAATGSAGAPGKNGMFVDAASMKKKLKEDMCKPKYNVADFYHKKGLFPYIAKHKVFEGATLSVIALNAMWIAVDTDHNAAETLLGALPVFQVAEHFFCTYFAFEWFVRYCSFRRKRDGLKDAWFCFDSIMVLMMVLETWLMTVIMLATGGGSSGGMGNASILRLARLLRLSRMARMARLLRAMPELMILIKGMVAAMRSVMFTLCLLLILTYVFGIMFTQLLVETEIGHQRFRHVLLSMHTLLIDGTLVDSLGVLVEALSVEGYAYCFLFYIFVLLSALTVMNMLIGVLCEVVSAVAATEKEELTVAYLKEKMQEVISALDHDGDGSISKDEFLEILNKPQAYGALNDVGVDVFNLLDIAEFIYEQNEQRSLQFPDFMELVLQFRGSNSATVKDIVDLRKFVVQTTNKLMESIEVAFSQHETHNNQERRHSNPDLQDGKSSGPTGDGSPRKSSSTGKLIVQAASPPCVTPGSHADASLAMLEARGSFQPSESEMKAVSHLSPMFSRDQSSAHGPGRPMKPDRKRSGNQASKNSPALDHKLMVSEVELERLMASVAESIAKQPAITNGIKTLSKQLAKDIVDSNGFLTDAKPVPGQTDSPRQDGFEELEEGLRKGDPVPRTVGSVSENGALSPGQSEPQRLEDLYGELTKLKEATISYKEAIKHGLPALSAARKKMAPV